ncbi:unnamed protein product [Moneuplotes crassus]|uniref:Uncharacterized protein n=1 Tax=Euplotes crassus TaxID=5936 RepID=A0AAD1UDH0_EUPCR|nr:unnamed protein product [Moneuplotes crassus]
MESEDQIVQEKLIQKISLEKSLLIESIQQEFQRCCCIYYNIFSEEIKARLPDAESDGHSVNYWFQLFFKRLKYMSLVKKLKFLKFFNVNKVELKIGKERNKNILNFIDFSLPNKMKDLNTYLTFEMKPKRATYFNSLVRISSKVTRRVGFLFFRFSLPQLKRLVAAYRHVAILEIWKCELSIPTVPDFSKALQNCQIKKISLWRIGTDSYRNWEDHPDEFKNLIQGFATSSDLRLSLKKVYIPYCRIKKSEAQKIFADNQLEGVEIIGGS